MPVSNLWGCFVFFVTICAIGHGTNFGLLRGAHGASFFELLRDAALRYQGYGVADGIAPAFRQKNATTCGAAAISYLLTYHGDIVFEEDYIDVFPGASNSEVSMWQLLKFAEKRGFSAIGKKGTAADLPSAGGLPVIAHLTRGHFVVVIQVKQKDAVLLFDPAYGLTLTVPHSEFLEAWSGHYLEVSTRELAVQGKTGDGQDQLSLQPGTVQ